MEKRTYIVHLENRFASLEKIVEREEKAERARERFIKTFLLSTVFGLAAAALTLFFS